jgi:hypothetical protein
MNRQKKMNIIECIRKNLKSPYSIIYALYNVSTITIGLILIMNTAVAETAAKEEQKHSWFEGTWLDDNWIPQSVQIHGFLSQGFVHTSDNNFFGESADSVSTDYREIGINGSWRVIPELQLSLQFVYRDAGLTDEDGVRVDYALADYSFYSTESTLLGLKGGRIPTPLGFYNETRDVLSTRPSILLPQSIYFDINRNIALSADGGYLYGEHRTEYGDIFFDIGGVVPRADDPEAKFRLTGDFPGEFSGKMSWVGRLAYEWQSGQVRLSVTYADLVGDYEPEPDTFNLLPGTFKFNPLVFSAQYNAENWSLTAEYALRRTRLTGFGLFPDNDTTGESYYVQGSYQFTSWMEGMVRYDNLFSNKDDKNGKQFEAATGLPNYSRFAHDWTFGLRFTVIPNLLISAEYHRVNGTAWLATIENKDPTKTEQYWDMYLMMISYDF